MTTGRSTADWYRSFGELEARGQSAVFEEWALGVAGDPQVLAVIDELPLQKRQPNLVFAVARLLGAPEGGYHEFRDWLLAHWPAVSREAVGRMTQTNEPRRCAALLPALGVVAASRAAQSSPHRPLALLELGASAGLCLYPDRYSYRYGDDEWLHPASGPSTVAIETETHGSAVPVPEALPEIVWRAGIDVEPLDVRDPDAVRWLETLVWPEQEARRRRIRNAVGLVRADPPILVRGNAIVELEALADARPADATLVVVTSAMLVYLPYAERMRLVDVIRSLDAHWISLDGVGVLPEIDAKLDGPGGAMPGRFTLSLDGEPLADVGPHGQFVDWFAPAAGARGVRGADRAARLGQTSPRPD
ncbi:MAG TPA: DUF2332 domain-containing protein [Terrimesophilobacter sp.]|nr:DUF2332 domain-containing protein [Terrimesophilobacter sp.]